MLPGTPRGITTITRLIFIHGVHTTGITIMDIITTGTMITTHITVGGTITVMQTGTIIIGLAGAHILKM